MNNDNFINNIKSILDKTNNHDINVLYNDMDFVEKILELELNYYLEKSLNDGTKNKKNGYTKDIALKVNNTEISINRPRLRNEANFDSIFVPKRTRIMKDIHDNILLLYSKNNSINDIKEILKGMFDIYISTGKISSLLQDISYSVYEWRNKKLDKCYFTINIDCTYITIRDNKDIKSHKIPIYVVVGTKLSGNKEILGIYLGNEDENKNIIDNLHDKNVSESTTFWTTVFEDLKERGVEKILYIVSDGLTGIKNAIKLSYPTSFYQRCVVHIVRDLKTYTNKNNSKGIIADFKNIYSSPSLELANENYEYFLDKYKDNKTIIKHVKDYMDEIMPLFNLPINIRKYIYTNNIVESVNSKIKRGFYGRGALPNINSALNIIFLNLDDLEKKWSKTKVPNWNNIYNELILVHKQDIEQYL